MSKTSLLAFDAHKWKTRTSSKEDRISAEGYKLVIQAGPKTDWWRTAVGSEPESGVNRTSGPLQYIEVEESVTHWTAGVWITGSFEERFQQATLFLGTGDYAQESAWVKAGIEVEDKRHNVGCVVSAPFSDWSISPLEKKIGRKEKGEAKLYIQFTRCDADVFVHYHVADVASEEPPGNVQLLREIKGFAAICGRGNWHLGLMVCGPLSQRTEAEWHNFSLKAAP